MKRIHCILLECKADLGRQDHIHLKVYLAPDISVSRLVNTLKTITSREIRKEFAEYLKPYYWKPVFWKRGYCSVSAGGVTKKLDKRGNPIGVVPALHRLFMLLSGATEALRLRGCPILDRFRVGASLTVLKQYIEEQGYDD